MKSLDLFLPDILPFAPACPVPTARTRIRSAVTKMCERARIWRESLTQTAMAGQNDITPPDGAVLFEVAEVYYEGDVNPLKRRSPDWLDMRCAGWRTWKGCLPEYVTQTAMNKVLLVPDFDDDATPGELQIDVYLKPAVDCLELPDFFVDQYRQVVAYGALAEILVLPDQKFTNPQLAAVNAGLFEDKLRGLADMNMRTQVRAPRRSRGSFC